MNSKKLKLYNFAVDARAVYYLMPPIMLLLFIGTVAQKYMGLYAASKLFFAGPLAWALLGALTFCLTLKFLFASEWSWRKSGIILSHLGVLILLYGGGLTALTAKEGYLVVFEGQAARTVMDYHQRDLLLLRGGQIVDSWDHARLKRGGKLETAQNIEIDVKDFCLNCDIIAREEAVENAFGMAAKVRLENKPAEMQDEANISGLTFAVGGSEYILFEGFTKPLPVEGYELIYGKAQRSLPFQIRLIDFEKQLYPNSNMARSYHSDIIVEDGDIKWPVRIEMNEPLRYKGYTLFQSSFIDGQPDQEEATILAVVENKGWVFPYIGTAIMALGLLVHMIIKASPNMARRAAVMAILILPVLLSCKTVQAESFNYQRFAELPVLHEGRVKPLDSFARIYLTRFAGQSKIDEQGAIVWLAEVIFTPERAENRKLFKITHPEIRQQLALSDADGRYISLTRLRKFLSSENERLMSLIAQDPETLSKAQNALLKLYSDALDFSSLTRSFIAFNAYNIDVPAGYKAALPDKAELSYLDIKRIEDDVYSDIAKLLKDKGEDFESYTLEESALVSFGFGLKVMREQNQPNGILRIVPSSWQGDEQWRAPWDVYQQGAGSPKSQDIIDGWLGIMKSYQSQDAPLWGEGVQKLHEGYKNYAAVDFKRIKAERIYHDYALDRLALLSYALSLFFIILAWARRPLKPYLLSAGFAFAILGGAANIALIALRIYVLDRPPVGTLYESILFVAAVAAMTAIVIELFQRRGFALASGVGCALALLALAPLFIQNGESFDMLVAVLNTSFWLTTHVLCITIGYALCIFAAILAHIYLFRRAFALSIGDKLGVLVFRVSIAALFFTAFGTVLGGIWADQSWGRFWGWDPKENGALLIVLWIIWALHGRHAGKLQPIGFAAVIGYLNVIVTLSWFGVNLLSVGLHSYGFISGIAYGITGLVAIETILIVSLMLRAKAKQKKVTHA